MLNVFEGVLLGVGALHALSCCNVFVSMCIVAAC